MLYLEAPDTLRIQDRYVLAEVARAVGAGLMLFVGLVVCVHQLQGFIRLIIREGYPVGAAIEVFFCFMPRTIAWVLPIAMIFGVLMAVGRLSSDGELTAMHAAGISFSRVVIPIALIGLVGVGVLYFLTEYASPRAIAHAKQLAWKYAEEGDLEAGFVHAIKDKDGKLEKVITAAKIDPADRRLMGVMVTLYRDDAPWMVFRAEEAVWEGVDIVLENVLVPIMPPPGERQDEITEGWMDYARVPVGLPPEEIARRTRKPETLTIPQMREWIAQQQAAGADYNHKIAPYLQEIATRRAEPWCVLGFALVSAPLGLRRIRSSTGVSLGMSVLVFMPYYFVSFTLQVINKHGGINPEIPAWTGVILLFIVAAGLILDKSR